MIFLIAIFLLMYGIVHVDRLNADARDFSLMFLIVLVLVLMFLGYTGHIQL